MKDFWQSGGASLRETVERPPQQATQYRLENSYGSFSVERTNQGVAVEVARKSSYHQDSQDSHPQARKALNQNRALVRSLSTGQILVDNLHSATGAVRYQDSTGTTAGKTIFQNLRQVKDSLYSQTLEEMLPDHQPQIQKKITRQIKKALVEAKSHQRVSPGFWVIPPLGERDPPPETPVDGSAGKPPQDSAQKSSKNKAEKSPPSPASNQAPKSTENPAEHPPKNPEEPNKPQEDPQP